MGTDGASPEQVTSALRALHGLCPLWRCCCRGRRRRSLARPHDYTVYVGGSVVATGSAVFETALNVVDAYSDYGITPATITTDGVKVCQETVQYTDVYTGPQ